MSEDSNELVIIRKIMMMMIIIMMVVGQTSRPICWSVSGSREEVASSRIRSLLPLHNMDNDGDCGYENGNAADDRNDNADDNSINR